MGKGGLYAVGRQNKCRYRFFLLVLLISKYAETLFQVKVRLYSDLRIN